MKKGTFIGLLIFVLIFGFAAIVATAVLTHTPTEVVATTPRQPSSNQAGSGSGFVSPFRRNSQIHGALSYVQYGYNRAYIFGSMHVGNPDFFPLAQIVEDAMRRADAFAFEYDLSLDDTLEGIMAALYFMFLPEGETLATYLSPDVHAHVVEILSTFYYIDYEDVNIFRPSVIETLMLYFEVAPNVGVYAEYSVDDYVFEFALDAGLPILGLVPMEHQMTIAFAPPHEVLEASILLWTDRNTMVEQTRNLVDAYAAQDMDAIRNMISVADADLTNPAIAFEVDVFMTQRTSEFAHEIDRLLRETTEPTTFFITIGIAHLLGDHGNAFAVLEGLGHTVNHLWE